MAPLLIGVVPFGLITGVTAGASVLGGLVGWATSPIIFAGAAQLATIGLFDTGAATLVIIATALTINARHLMYSAALAPSFREFPRGWRFALPYLLTDQAFAPSIVRYETADDPLYRRWFFLGAAASLWITWQTTTGIGVVFGSVIPPEWSLGFAIPLVFMALLVPALRTRPALLAAVVGGVVSVVAASAPYSSGLIIAAVCGVLAGTIADGRMR